MSNTAEALRQFPWKTDTQQHLAMRAAARIEQLETGLWDVHAYCNNWDWFLWMWPIRRIKRIARAALGGKDE